MMQIFEVKEQMQPVEKNPENQKMLHVQDYNFLSMIEEIEWSLCAFSSIFRKHKIIFQGITHPEMKWKSKISPHIVR